ncbi:MAG: hypothetical protein LUE12_00385 [Ruminococcus sp.]|nr:hypothetical protein [Ruminococcus sp.]
MNIDEIIDLMEELLDNSSAVPFSNKKLIDCEQMRDYIDQIRLGLPAEIKKAKETQENKETILAEATAEGEKIKKQAEEIVEAAKQQAMQIVSETEIIKQATEIGTNMIQDAEKKAEEIVANATEKDAEIRRALSDSVNETLTQAQSILQKNLTDIGETIAAVENLNKTEEPAESAEE